MKDTLSLRPVQEMIIVIFCLWHCAAVFVYLLPSTTPRPFSPIISHAKDIVSPYMLSMSQWQWWDIFSPNPLRRVSIFRIDVSTNGSWKPVRTISYATLHWTERVKQLKILGRLEDDWKTLVPFYLLPACKMVQPSGGVTLRLVAVSTVLPDKLRELYRLSATKKTSSERVLGSVLCSHQ